MQVTLSRVIDFCFTVNSQQYRSMLKLTKILIRRDRITLQPILLLSAAPKKMLLRTTKQGNNVHKLGGRT